MKKKKFYFLRKVTPPVLNEFQDDIEAAIQRLMAKRTVLGLTSTALPAVTPTTGYNLTFDSQETDPVAGFDGNGQFVELPANPHTEDFAGDFTLPGAGNEKWLTIILRFARDESQPEVERKPPVFTTVNFRQDEGFELVLLEGAEAAAGTAVKPSLTGETGIYLADVLVDENDADFTTATIAVDTTRQTVDALAEAGLRGLDAIVSKIALVGGANGIILESLGDVATDLSQAIRDTGGQRAAAADQANPLATMADVPSGVNELSGAQSQSTLSTGAINPWIDFTWPVGSKRLNIDCHQALGENENAHGRHVIDLNLNQITGFGVAGSTFIGFSNDTFNGTPVSGGQRLDGLNIFIQTWDPGNRRIVLRLDASPVGARSAGATIEAY